MRRFARILLLAAIAASSLPAAAQTTRFSFGVLASAGMDDRPLRETMARADANNLAFVVALGVKPTRAACENAVYERRSQLFDRSQHGLVPLPHGSDWAACPARDGQVSELARLTRLRELLFQGEFSFGATRLPLVRQATEARFGNFVENVRWEIGDVMFATINLPAPNNHFMMGAGRNGEFEDRLVANREWLYRVFTQARLQKARAVVLFSEANPLSVPRRVRRDGFSEMRRYLHAHAKDFPGKVLIVHAQPAANSPPAAINWRGDLGEIGVAGGWVRLQFDPGLRKLLAVAAKQARQ